MCSALGALGLTGATAGATPMSRRPNILFVLADDWGWTSSRAIDELGMTLPNFERVKRAGLTFTNAFCAAPTCTASRGAILTGRAPWQLEEGANLASILPAKFAVYPEMLERAGYHVGFAGKGWAPGQLKPAGRARNPAGDAYPDFAGFLAFLRTDPQFYAKTPDELLGVSAYVAKRVDGKLKDTIGLLPRYRFTIVPVPAAIAPYYTSGRGGLESGQMNTYDLPSRPLYQIPALTLHECNPGHSFQAAVALEQTGRPAFRKQTYFSGYGEGWALYMEWLGTKMGVYETPYDEFGRETYEMWRAARLVVDTGLHHMGWSRQQALDYLSSHTALSDHEVTIEVDRYINDPGQALAYKLGEMLIRRKRAEAEAKLGAAFDQRWFHDVILGLGSVPLPTLEKAIDDWIAGGGKNPNAATAA